MSRRRRLSDEEHALWAGYSRSVAPLQRREPTQNAEASAAEKQAAPQLPQPAPRQKPPEKNAPPLAPLGRRLRQRVARGREPIEARLDLHGYTQTQAHAALLRFLHGAQADGVKMALVVTGKGTGKARGAHEGGVLKRQVPLWLALPEFRSLVVGFEDAHTGHGGAGALYVRLRRLR